MNILQHPRLLVLVVVFGFSGRESAAQDPSDAQQPTAAESRVSSALAADLDTFDSLLNSRWALLDTARSRGFDPSKARRQAAARLKEGGPRALSEALRGWLRAMGDPQGFVREKPHQIEPRVFVPFRVVECTEGVLVLLQAPDWAGEPEAGWLWTDLGGSKLADRLNQLELEDMGVTAALRRANALERLHEMSALTLKMHFQTPAGDAKSVDIKARSAPPPASPRPYGREVELHWLSDELALIRVPTLDAGDADAWSIADTGDRDSVLDGRKAALDSLMGEVLTKKAKGLILDLRDASGSADELAIHLAEYFVDGPFTYVLRARRDDGRISTPAGAAFGRSEHVGHFHGALCVLINEGTSGVAERLVHCLDDHLPDLLLIGRPTAGVSNAERLWVHLPVSGLDVALSGELILSPKGRPLDGESLVPDLSVRWTRQSWMSGEDPDLQAAQERMQKMR